jgi:predicted phosphodiesterase
MLTKLFKFLKGSKSQSITISNLDDYYNFLMQSNDANCYSFESKYANQEDNLLKLCGQARTLNGKIKLLIIADTHNTLDEEEFKSYISTHNNYDVCLLLGDFGYRDLPIILNYVDKNKIYALLGNHDHDYIKEYNLNNLNGNIIDINGIKLLGIQGSFKYKPVDFPSFSQKGSIDFLNDKEAVDILVSHDARFNSNSERDPAHQGLFGITYYLFKNKVPYHIHGHIHDPYKTTMINGTKEISVLDYEFIEL